MKKRIIYLMPFLVILIVGIIFSYSQQVPNPGHGGNELLVSVDGYTMTLQEAIDNDFLVDNGPVPTQSYTTSVSGGHDTDNIFVSVNGVEMTLQDAIALSSRLSSDTSSSYTSDINFGHNADKVWVSIEGAEMTLQDAINAGEFNCDCAPNNCFEYVCIDPGKNQICSGTKNCVVDICEGLTQDECISPVGCKWEDGECVDDGCEELCKPGTSCVSGVCCSNMMGNPCWSGKLALCFDYIPVADCGYNCYPDLYYEEATFKPKGTFVEWDDLFNWGGEYTTIGECEGNSGQARPPVGFPHYSSGTGYEWCYRTTYYNGPHTSTEITWAEFTYKLQDKVSSYTLPSGWVVTPSEHVYDIVWNDALYNCYKIVRVDPETFFD